MKTAIRDFWNRHPLGSYEIGAEPGTKEYFDKHDKIRRDLEFFSYELYRFDNYDNKKVLDIGCGNGWVVCEYAKRKANVIGVDLTKKAMELTSRRLDFLGLEANLAEADAENLPFLDNSFDLVTSIGVLHHTPDIQKAIGEIYRVLKKDRECIIVVYYKNILLNKLMFPFLILFLKIFKIKMHGIKKIKWVSPNQFVRQYDGRDNPLGSAYNKRQIRRMFNKFRDLKVEVHYFPKRFLPFGNLIPKWILYVLDRFFGFSIYINGRK